MKATIIPSKKPAITFFSLILSLRIPLLIFKFDHNSPELRFSWCFPFSRYRASFPWPTRFYNLTLNCLTESMPWPGPPHPAQVIKTFCHLKCMLSFMLQNLPFAIFLSKKFHPICIPLFLHVSTNLLPFILIFLEICLKP